MAKPIDAMFERATLAIANKLVPQPTRADSLLYDMRARVALAELSNTSQSPAMDREPLAYGQRGE